MNKKLSRNTIIIIILAAGILIEGIVFGCLLLKRNNSTDETKSVKVLSVQVDEHLQKSFEDVPAIELRFGDTTVSDTPERLFYAYRIYDSFANLVGENATEELWESFQMAFYEYARARYNTFSSGAQFAKEVSCESFGALESQFPLLACIR